MSSTALRRVAVPIAVLAATGAAIALPGLESRVSATGSDETITLIG